jgi:hypothetical protein
VGIFGYLRNALLLMTLVVLIVGCSNESQNSNKDDSDNTNISNDNPFELNDEDAVIMGTIGHGFVNPKLDESGRRLPLQYNGGELEINYYVNASGKAKNVGFLVFVDGIPQPYKFNTTEAPYEYMHIINLEEDNKDTPFTFFFTPVKGKQGDTLNVSITSIYNPAFIPDMKETSSYGGYHEALGVVNPLFFEKNAEALEASKIPKYDYLNNVSLSKEPITDKLLEKYNVIQKVDLETLEKQVFSELYFDGESAMNVDNLQVNDSGTLHVNFKLFGHPGVRYRNTFYINHQALSTNDGDTSFEVELAKGEVAVIDAEIDLERLEDFNTFYVVSVPMNAEDFPDDVIVLQKTQSILLYK